MCGNCNITDCPDSGYVYSVESMDFDIRIFEHLETAMSEVFKEVQRSFGNSGVAVSYSNNTDWDEVSEKEAIDIIRKDRYAYFRGCDENANIYKDIETFQDVVSIECYSLE